MNRFKVVSDKAVLELPSEFISKTRRRIRVVDVKVFPPTNLEEDIYILHANFAVGNVDTGTDRTRNFVCFCNQPYQINKEFLLLKNYRDLHFWFSSLKQQDINPDDLQFIIDLELY